MVTKKVTGGTLANNCGRELESRMAAGGSTSKDVIARMYGLTPEQLEEILK